MRLEELEYRLAPASFAVDAQLHVTRLDGPGEALGETHAVVFFESNVADYQVLRQGLDAETDAVVLDSGGDGLREMAAFLADCHNFATIGVVAHGAPGAMTLGNVNLNEQSLGCYANELAVLGSALGRGGELDLWSCDVAAGEGGASLVRDLAAKTGVGVAAAASPVGAVALGGNWQLDVRLASARGDIPFSNASLAAFQGLLGSWSPAAPMLTGRSNASATLLSNGEVLVAGGNDITNGNVGNVLSSAELYIPTTNTWSPAASMGQPRSGQIATLLRDGRVLLIGQGGFNGPSSAEVYDPASDSWSDAGSLSVARTTFTATLLNNGQVLVTGGYLDNGPGSSGTFLSSAELYDPVSNTWSDAAPMAQPRSNHTATLLSNGKVLVAGGENLVPGAGFVSILSTAELYDPATNTWSPAAPMGKARLLFGATLLNNGKVLVAGGVGHAGPTVYLSSAELYAPPPTPGPPLAPWPKRASASEKRC
jgi:N-acetylneuraminic acid mutarotase